MSRELRKERRPKKHFDETEEPSRTRTAPSPIKRPNKRRQQPTSDTDNAVDAAVAMMQMKRSVRAFQQREQPAQALTPPSPPPSAQPPARPRISLDLELDASVLNSSPRISQEEEIRDTPEAENSRPDWWLEWSVFVGKNQVYSEVLESSKFDEYQGLTPRPCAGSTVGG